MLSPSFPIIKLASGLPLLQFFKKQNLNLLIRPIFLSSSLLIYMFIFTMSFLMLCWFNLSFFFYYFELGIKFLQVLTARSYRSTRYTAKPAAGKVTCRRAQRTRLNLHGPPLEVTQDLFRSSSNTASQHMQVVPARHTGGPCWRLSQRCPLPQNPRRPDRKQVLSINHIVKKF